MFERIFFHIGRFFIMLKKCFARPEKFYVYWREFVRNLEWMGIGSLLLVIVIAVFVGAVTTVQSAYQLVSSLIPVSVIGSIVADSTLLELAPTITSVVLAGRIGSRLASELATMRVTEQIDALEVMGLHVEAFLVMPRIVAAVVVIPVLIVLAAIIGIVGGMLIGHFTDIVPMHDFIQGAQETFRPMNVIICLTKAYVFSFIIGSVSSYVGFYTEGGALDVGRASTTAVVASSLIILVFDYVIAEVLLT